MIYLALVLVGLVFLVGRNRWREHNRLQSHPHHEQLEVLYYRLDELEAARSRLGSTLSGREYEETKAATDACKSAILQIQRACIRGELQKAGLGDCSHPTVVKTTQPKPVTATVNYALVL